jgi:hypothetical protein
MNKLIKNTFYYNSICTASISSILLANYCYNDTVHTNNVFPKNLRFPLGVYSGVLGGMTGALLGGTIGATFPISYPILGYYYFKHIRELKLYKNQ